MPETETIYESKALAMVSLPTKGTKVAVLMVCGLLIGAICLTFIPWQQTVSAPGEVAIYSPMDRPQNVESQISGRIKQWHVKEGQEIAKGDPIVSLDETDHKFLDPNLVTSKKKQKEGILKRLGARERRVKALQDHLDHLRQSKGDTVAAHELEVELATAIESVAATEQEVHAAEIEIGALERRAAFRNIHSAIAGTIIKTLKSAGETVSSGTTLAIIAPHTEDLSAELTVAGTDAPLVSRGELVRLQFAGFPAVQFAGGPTLAAGTFAGRIEAVDPVDDGKGNYRAIVLPDKEGITQKKEQPWPSSKRLRPGSQVNGWIILKIVPLGVELWRRVNALPPASEKPQEPQAATKKITPFKP